ncbi:MAG: hypothetical protein AAGE01_03005 [Pseudomonadota bacterium]
MDSLSQWANIAEIFSALTVVFGVSFGAIQLMYYRRQRQDLAAIELVKTFQGRRFTSAIRLILTLPTQCTTSDISNEGTEMEDAAMTVANTVEAIGLMVHQRTLDIDTARNLMGGLVMGSWTRLKCWVEQQRVDLERDDFGEWYQWLAERLLERCDSEDHRAPAHIRERNWKFPRR